MTQLPNGQPCTSRGLFPPAERVRIAQLALGKTTEPGTSPYIEAVVSLVLEPYSGKQKSLSLLLTEPDVRLRRAHGQLKVTFQGSAAQQLASSQLCIGDTVLLRIDHAEWRDTGDAVETPGKKVQWDLHFMKRVILEARRDGGHLTSIDYEGPDTPPALLDRSSCQKAKSQQINGFHESTSISFSTPAHRRSKRVSSESFIDASLDPFADDDGFVLGKGRKRTKYGRTSGSWKLLGEGETSDRDDVPEATPEVPIAHISEEDVSSSPAKPHGLQDVIMLDDDSTPETSPVENSMPPPLAPFQLSSKRARESSPQIERLVSPRLYPLASPGLPMVSPLVKIQGASTGYFDFQSPASSELDAISAPAKTPQGSMLANNPDLEESFNPGFSEDHEPFRKSPRRIASETQSDSAFQNFEPLPGIPFEDNTEIQPLAVEYPTAASPVGSAFSGLPGSSSFHLQPKSTLKGTDFGTGMAQSSLATASLSSGLATNFHTIGNSSTFGIPDGNGSGVGFDFATRQTEISTGPGPQDAIVSHEQLDDDTVKRPSQETEVTIDEHCAKRSFVHVDLKSSRRERYLSEHDDDMYGSARPKAQTPNLRSVASGRPESISRNGEELLDIAMFGVDTGEAPPVALPSPEVWNNMTQITWRSMQRSASLDGASDEISENEALERDPAAREIFERGSTPMSSQSLEFVQSVEARDTDGVDFGSSTVMKEVATFESVTRAQIAAGPILELQGRSVPQMQAEERLDSQTNDDDNNVDDLSTIEHELEEVEAKQATEQVIVLDPQTDKHATHFDGDELKTRSEQILTPDNTQQEFLERHSFDHLQQVPSLQMPPTPENTQEPAYGDVARLNGPSESQSFERRQANVEVSLPAPARIQKVGSRPTRKSLTTPAVSSPYFTPRRSARLSPERQMQDNDTADVDEEIDQEPAIQDLPAQISQQTSALSPRRDKRLHNMLGMTTSLSYYTPLPNLDEHYGQEIDILAICTAESGDPTRSKAGPKDFNATLHLADYSLDGAATITAQLFRPYKEALPVVHRGEVILLRSIKVQSQKRKMMLLSTNSSAWAVFSLSDISPKDAEYWDLQIDVVGPPVECGSEEYVYAKRLLEWWETDGSLVHKVFVTKNGDPLTRPTTRDGSDRAYATGDEPEHVTKKATNGHVDAYKSQAIDPPRTARSSKSSNKNTDNMEKDNQKRSKSAPLSPTFEPASPIPARTTRSTRRSANRTDNIGNDEDSIPADTIEPLPDISSPKASRRVRRSTPLSETPEPSSRTLRSQSTVHELRDGTKYVDGHVPTKKDGVHVLRDGTKYIDENVSPIWKPPSVRDESVVHELRDGTNYVDRSKSSEVRRSARHGSSATKTPSFREESVVHELRDGMNYVDRDKSPEVRRSARNRRGGSLVHELRDGAKYTDG